MDVCVKKGLFLAKTLFQFKMIPRYTWMKNDGREEQKGLNDNVVPVNERLRKALLDA